MFEESLIRSIKTLKNLLGGLAMQIMTRNALYKVRPHLVYINVFVV